MNTELEKPVTLRNSRTPREGLRVQDAVRESLLSDSTSGIEKDDDSSSFETDTFSSPDIDVSNIEHHLIPPKENGKQVNSFFDEKQSMDTQTKADQIDQLKESKVKITDNPHINVDKVHFDRALSTIEEPKVPIPDGGWGWIVVLSSFIISMIADGISFSFGLLYIEFLDEFQASKSTTAWIGSLFIAVPLLSGPVMSALVDRYGCRSMTILGGIISTIGFVLASISTTLEMMMITFGVIAGLGLGLVYVTAVVSIAYWFEKKRNLAVGLGACGTGVGTFVYAPMTQYFIEEYGWRGAILLLSGTLLNLCVCGCVMRDPEWWILEQKNQRKKDKRKKEECRSRNSSSVSISTPYDFDATTKEKNIKDLSQQKIAEEVGNSHGHETTMLLKKEHDNNRRSRSVVNLPSYEISSDKVSTAMLSIRTKKDGTDLKHPQLNNNEDQVISNNAKENEDNNSAIITCKTEVLKRANSEKYDGRKEKLFEECQLKSPKTQRPPMRKSKSETRDSRELIKQDSKESRKDWLKKQLSVNHHYLRDLKMPMNSISHRNAILNIKRYRLKASSCPDILKNSMITVNEQEEKWYDDCTSCLADMFNVALFKEMPFNLLCFGTIILFIWFIVPYFYLAEHMIHKGFSEDDGALMLSVIGITNTIGMVGLGWIGDFPKVSIGSLYAVCLMFCGATVAAIPLAVTNYWILMSISAAFGLLFAASFTFTPSLLVKLVSLDDFTSAYGLVLLAQGIGHLIGPPLSGLIYDLTLSWELAFYLAGFWIIIAGVLISLIQPVRTFLERRKSVDRSESSLA
ncbi:monocarboxylate transporter 14-like [Epargyreus clarus]|uniref:monocarboxylate transporter 14-like n=1 Tax=Epargyreus clarus TaxID=520877 RepID=UPI003C2AB0DD